MNKAFIKELKLEEAVKRFNQLNEYTFITSPMLSEDGEDDEQQPMDNIQQPPQAPQGDGNNQPPMDMNQNDSNSQPPMGNDTSSMNNNQQNMPMGGEDMGQMGDMNSQPPMNDMPPMDNDMGGEDMGSEFDTNFDAGVDADEESDPKKYIQQLTGKLSQTLRKYNSEQPQVDSELSKYVVGMIAKQAIEGLDEKDTADILKKIKSDEDFEEPTDDLENDEDIGNDDMGDMNAQPPMNDTQNQMPMESIDRRKQIDEIFQDLTNTDKDNENNSYKTMKPNNSFRKKPFSSPNFR